jgi:hypothetical protein
MSDDETKKENKSMKYDGTDLTTMTTMTTKFGRTRTKNDQKIKDQKTAAPRAAKDSISSNFQTIRSGLMN